MPSRDLRVLVPLTTTDLAGGQSGVKYRLYSYPLSGGTRLLAEFAPDQGPLALAVNGDGSRVATLISHPGDLRASEGVLFTPSGQRELPGVAADAREFSFDSAGRRLAFLSSENLTGENPARHRQLFVAVIALDSDTPTPTRTPTRTPLPTNTVAPPQLAGALSETGNTVIYLNDARALPSNGIVQIDNEFIAYSSGSDTALFGLTRGACGSTPAAHAAAAPVTLITGGCPPTPTPTITPTRTSTPPRPSPTPGPCYGDCGDDGHVSIDELVQGVNIALGTLPLTDCPSFDTSNDDRVTVDELVKAVNAALVGCV